jgi:hypothetical protein
MPSRQRFARVIVNATEQGGRDAVRAGTVPRNVGEGLTAARIHLRISIIRRRYDPENIESCVPIPVQVRLSGTTQAVLEQVIYPVDADGGHRWAGA